MSEEASDGSGDRRLRALCDLSARLEQGVGDEALGAWLDSAVELLAADRIAAFTTGPDGALVLLQGRALRHALSRAEREELSRTLVRSAVSEGRTAAFEHGAEEAPESVRSLGILSAFAVPLWRGRPRWGAPAQGALYVDVRSARSLLRAWSREYVEVAAALLSHALAPAGESPNEERPSEAAPAYSSRSSPSLAALLAPPSMRTVASELTAALRSRAPVLITGPSGSGKTAVATAFARAAGLATVVRVTLGGSDDLNTITSELFGHEKGAFTGAARRRPGLVELADGGALVLDELLNLPVHAQRLLLDLVQFGTYRPLGWERAEPRTASLRIVACTHGDLRAAVASGALREDLYFRLAGVRVEIPPLRARRDELVSLLESHLERAHPGRGFRAELGLRQALCAPELAWKGNLRQLFALGERLANRALGRDPSTAALTLGDLRPEDLDEPSFGAPSSGASLLAAPQGALASQWETLRAQRASLDEDECLLVREALARHGGVVAHAARALGVSRTSLLSRMSTLGVERPDGG